MERSKKTELNKPGRIPFVRICGKPREKRNINRVIGISFITFARRSLTNKAESGINLVVIILDIVFFIEI
jgi:hypothetical protein